MTLHETAGSGKIDLALVLDTSGSTRNDRFFSIQNFVADLIERLEIGENKTQVAALQFCNTTEVRTSPGTSLPGTSLLRRPWNEHKTCQSASQSMETDLHGTFNPLKCSGIRQSHLTVFNAI